MLRICWLLLLYFALFETTKNARGDLNDTILNIFRFGPEPGVHIFNTTRDVSSFHIVTTTTATATTAKSTIASAFNSHSGTNNKNNHNPHNPNQKLNPKQHSKPIYSRDEPFKVLRAPDGKLNLLFNELSYLQPKTEAPHPLKTNKTNADFVYPDEFREAPKCADKSNEGKPFCTKVVNYPDQKQLDDLLKPDLSTYSIFFGEDLVQPVNISQRMDSTIDEDYFCRSRQKTIYPESGTTRDSNVLLIVNKYAEYKQGVVVEECINEGASCDVFNSIPLQYKTTCKQHYSFRPLLAILDGKVVREHFKMPSCCKCAYKQLENSGSSDKN